jgi:hypothetical protein
VLSVIHDWLGRLESTGFASNPLKTAEAPKLFLIDGRGAVNR